MNIKKVKSVYFLGIGGIGMSALARYFMKQGAKVSGYDLVPARITDELIREGAAIHFEEDISQIDHSVDIVIHTPAVSIDHKEYQYFKEKGIPIYKRSEILGMLSGNFSTIAVAGTHGKTTTTSMITQIFHGSKKIIAFIGGIAKNFNSNFIMDDHCKTMIVEADEFDRSFLTLSPDMAVITSMDADHLDVYGQKEKLQESFQLFANRIKGNGKLIIHESVYDQVEHDEKISYGFAKWADYAASNVRLYPNKAVFDITHGKSNFYNIKIGVSGQHNVLNALAAFAVAHQSGVESHTIVWNLSEFTGVQRRFDYQIERDDLIFVDDYAHHPEEIKAILNSLRNIYPRKKITGIFQPHLYTRTRDFADDFAKALSSLNRVILLDIYPAREKPIEGISSQYLLDLLPNSDKMVLKKEEVIPFLLEKRPEVLVTLGAGDIDKLVPEIKAALSK